MTIEQLQAKLEKGEALSTEEQHELWLLVEQDFNTLKQQDPKAYLALTTQITEIISTLNKKIREA